MEFTPVTSTIIEAVHYDNMKNLLLVKFYRNADPYPYHGVPVELYEEMMAAPSVGRFYAKNIKGRFQNEPQSESGVEPVEGDS